jgi:hypothetical protein
MVMVVPEDADIHEAEEIGEQDGQAGEQRSQRGFMRRLDFQHHDGDDDRHHAIGERLEPVRFHLLPPIR